jgi:thioredoxin 1
MSRIYRIILLMLSVGGIFLLMLPLQALGAGSENSIGKPALYEFGAGYCQSCKVMEQVIGELKKSHGDQVEFRLVYTDKDQDLFKQYKILLIPTQVFLNAKGKEVDQHMGPLTREEVLQKLKDLKLIK